MGEVHALVYVCAAANCPFQWMAYTWNYRQPPKSMTYGVAMKCKHQGAIVFIADHEKILF